jgi:phosphate transport system protein
MSKHLQRDMNNLHREILSLSAMVEDMFDKATRALSEGRYELCSEVISADERVDRLEVRIEEECLKMLALHQPVAGDLRRIATVLKVNSDLERIADLAVNIADRARSIHEHPPILIPEIIQRMVEVTARMVRGALNAFVNLDPQQARQIMLMDDDVDRANVEAITELQAMMRASTALVEPALHCFSASRHIERIADHATNIAEDVIYLVEGDIVRHRHNTMQVGARRAN